MTAETGTQTWQLPTRLRAEVRGTCTEGAYVRVGLHAPEVAERAEPGQFVALTVGGEPTATLLRRCFSIAQVAPERGDLALLIAPVGPGSTWLTRRPQGDSVDLVGPLGRPFPAPVPGAGCVLVGGGYGAAPMVWWARELVAAGHPVALVLGAADAVRLAEVDGARALDVPVFVTTDDGSAGVRGRVTDALPTALHAVASVAVGPESVGPESVGPELVAPESVGAESVEAAAVGAAGAGLTTSPVEIYACGPMAMLRAVTEAGAQLTGGRARVWCAVEEAMACGVGVCMTCVLPVRDENGQTKMRRACVEGPTFAGNAVRWEAMKVTPTLLGGSRVGAAVPVDCVGAPR